MSLEDTEKSQLIEGNQKWWKTYAIEIYSMLYFLTITMSQLMEAMMLLDLACSKVDKNGTCIDGDSAQNTVSGINSWKQTLEQVFNVLVSLYLGLLIDKNSKFLKFALFYPVIGQICCDFGNIASALNSWSPYYVALYECLVIGFSGSMVTYAGVSACFISHITKDSDRTERMSYLYGAIGIGIGAGTTLSGLASSYVGLSNGFIFSVCLNLIGTTFALLTITKPEIVETEREISTDFGASAIWNYIRAMIQKNREMKIIIFLSFLCLAFTCIPYAGESVVVYLYTNYKFNWTDAEFSVLMLFKFLVQCIIGTFVTTLVLKQYFKMEDTSILILESIVSVIGNLALVLVQTTWQLYIGTGLQVFFNSIQGVTVAFVTKQFSAEEFGKMSSVVSVVRGLSSALGFTIYNLVYQSTFTFFPSAFFGVSLIFLLLTLICASYLHFFLRRHR